MGPKTGHISRHRGLIRAVQARAFANTCIAMVLAMMLSAPAYAGDILRGGATRASDAARAQALANTGQAQALKLRANAQDRLARTSQALQNLQAAQASARAAAANVNHLGMNPLTGVPLPVVPDGLGAGGLDLDRVVSGAKTPVQSGNTVTVQQTAAQAMLHWKTFNVGRNTTLNFDQSAGGADAGKWIAFNKVTGKDVAPSQILGRINAQGQVYVLNQNGVIFGGSSQINTRALVASSLPINDNLVQQGLLNNRDAQFIFSTLEVPGGTDGTPAFVPDPPAGGVYGDVTVQRGAQIRTSVSAEGGGGRVMLVGPNVHNAGTIETPSGQTILAAGNQVGMAPHSSDDPSLRGLDVWVGETKEYSGDVHNTGIIEARLGSILLTGKTIRQSGAVESSTSVKLNGRIDLKANYGAVANPDFDLSTGGGPIFVYQHSGSVSLQPGSITRVLPEYGSSETVAGLSLSQRSQINIEGLTVSMLESSTIFAPNASVRLRAGRWLYKDSDGNRSVFLADGKTIDPVFSANRGLYSDLFLDIGQVFLDRGSILDVSGTTDAFVPLAQSVVAIQLRGNELADSPSQRSSAIRGKNLIVDLRRSGQYQGSKWIGTPLGDLTSIPNIIERDVSQLTADGGNVAISAGGSVVIQPGSLVDVSGGYYRNQGGRIQTTRLMSGRRILDIADAAPDAQYDGIYTGTGVRKSAKWGIEELYSHPLAPLGVRLENDYFEGANGGAIQFTAPAIVLGGQLAGQTVVGPRQMQTRADLSSLVLNFQASKRIDLPGNRVSAVKSSPTPPRVFVTSALPAVAGYQVADGSALAASLTSSFDLSSKLWSEEFGGFGHVMVDNREGSLLVPEGVSMELPVGGSFAARAANINFLGQIVAPGGSVDLTAYNFSPYTYAELTARGAFSGLPEVPDPVAGAGSITLGRAASINVAGMLVDDRNFYPANGNASRTISGGSVTLESYNINLNAGSRIDASGGVLARFRGGFDYGGGGSISLLAGRDPLLVNLTGGSLVMNGSVSAYSAARGGSLSLRSDLIQVGGASAAPTALLLSPDFFRTGGFTSYTLTGIGQWTQPARSTAQKIDFQMNPPAKPPLPPGVDEVEDSYIPAVRFVAGTLVEPVAMQMQVKPFNETGGQLAYRLVLNGEAERYPASLRVSATGADDDYTRDFVEVRGDVLLERGSLIRTDAGGSVLLGTDDGLSRRLADTVTVEGRVIAPGGTVAAFGRDKFRLATETQSRRTYALPTVYLGPEAYLSTAGRPVYDANSQGFRSGSIYTGGTISLAGNIVAEPGSILDVSGGSGIFDLPPVGNVQTSVGIGGATAGLTRAPLRGRFMQTVAAQLQTDGGNIDLRGAEMLFVDSTLAGSAGGSRANGGRLSIFSGRHYTDDSTPRTSADINLVVNQSALSLVGTKAQRGVGLKVAYAGSGVIDGKPYMAGDAVPGMGYFAADSFQRGGFDSLDLGYDLLVNAQPVLYGGNVFFRGNTSISAAGSLRVAGGGIIRADSDVTLAAKYLAVGQPARPPEHPLDTGFVSFEQFPVTTTEVFNPQPTYGNGGISFSADLIDIGTTVFDNMRQIAFAASGGDIRGEGTLSSAADVRMVAGQIYPSTLADFKVFVYDPNIAVATSSLSSKTVKLASANLPPGFGVGSLLLGSTVDAVAGDTVTLSANANRAITSTTLLTFAAGQGRVDIAAAGTRPAPLSAGGSLSIYASQIAHSGTLRAPFGSVNLGWDGSDLDLTTVTFESPVNTITGTAISTPVARAINLLGGSLISVSGLDSSSGFPLLIPYGLSPDGITWYDPSGADITARGMPQKSVAVAGDAVIAASDSVIDMSGGGNLLAHRWLAGTGGSRDVLAEPLGEWSDSRNYEAGDVVNYKGSSWSARRSINPTDFRDSSSLRAVKAFKQSTTLSADLSAVTLSPPKPGEGSIYWSLLPESYAIIPGYAAGYAPRGAYNTGENARVLGGDPGFTSAGLPLGTRIDLEAGAGLPAGAYTLLPRRYALLPGAYLVAPMSTGPVVAFSTSSGATDTSGYTVSVESGAALGGFTALDGSITLGGRLSQSLGRAGSIGPRMMFELSSPSVVAARAKYATYDADSFARSSATRLQLPTLQAVPSDAGSLSLHGNSTLLPGGRVLTAIRGNARGAVIDVSSGVPLHLVGGTQAAPVGSTAVLRSEVAMVWGADSLLLGGLRKSSETATTVDVRAPSLVVNNQGARLSAPDLVFVSKNDLLVSEGSRLESVGTSSRAVEGLSLGAAGSALRLSSLDQAQVIRTGVSSTAPASLRIGDNVSLSGRNLVFDSTRGAVFGADLDLASSSLVLQAGQIAVLLDNASRGIVGPDELRIREDFVQGVNGLRSLALSSYGAIDLYGSGALGFPGLAHLGLASSAIRGLDGGQAVLTATRIGLGNPLGVAPVASSLAPLSGRLTLQSEGALALGANVFGIHGFQNVDLIASGGLVAAGSGGLSMPGSLNVSTPLITGEQGVDYSFAAEGVMSLQSAAGAPKVDGGLGASLSFAGSTLTMDALVRLPGGSLALRAANGNVRVGGDISLVGSSRQFNDVLRYTDAGSVELSSATGHVVIAPSGKIDLSAPGGGSAGMLVVAAPKGEFRPEGQLSAAAVSGETAGVFRLDVSALDEFGNLSAKLQNAGFREEIDIRVRNDDVTVDGSTTVRNFELAADSGSIFVKGSILANGATGGAIALSARGSVTLEDGSILDVSADDFNSAGKGGSVRLEAGAVNTLLDPTGGGNAAGGFVNVLDGSTIRLGVATFAPGGRNDIDSSVFLGRFNGTLHLRAPRHGQNVNIGPLLGEILDPSSVVVEPFLVYRRSDFATSTALRNHFHSDNQSFMAGEVAMKNSLLSLSPSGTALQNSLVIAPGVEILQLSGDLVIGTAGNNNGNAPADDWDLSTYRYGSSGSPGMLTLRSVGNLTLQNTLSDGFRGHTTEQLQAGVPAGRSLWLAGLMAPNDLLPLNTQSWSYRLVAGADLTSSSYGRVRPLNSPDLGSDSGLVTVGNFYTGNLGGSGSLATTALAIAPGQGTTTRFQVVRTGTGNIDVHAAREVQLRNPFATIYTAGVSVADLKDTSTPGTKVPDYTRVFSPGDFAVPEVEFDSGNHPDQGGDLGVTQQIYPAQWAFSGGNVLVEAQGDIRRVNRVSGNIVTDTARQIPSNWLYRRGFVDSDTGRFGITGLYQEYKVDRSASTTWWIDYSNFFQGVGALGGGHVVLASGRDIVNVDAVLPTTARTEGFEAGGANILAAQARTSEHGGGDLLVRAGRNIDGGLYYVERGEALLQAGNAIKSNPSRSVVTSANPDEKTWLPTGLYAGRASFDVKARGNILLGPVVNSFMLPAGLNNKFWYKTYFQTYGTESGLQVASYGGNIDLQYSVYTPGSLSPTHILQMWMQNRNRLGTANSSAIAQPWLRLGETRVDPFASLLTLAPTRFEATAFSGSINTVGNLSIFPSTTGSFELVAAGGITGLNPAGRTTVNRLPVTAWSSSSINISDADPSAIPGILSPFAYQSIKGRFSGTLNVTEAGFLQPVSRFFEETGSYTGRNSAIDVKSALRAKNSAYAASVSPVRLYAMDGDITGLTLFSPKFSRITASRDITDVSFYLQNLRQEDVSLVAAGRNIVPYNASATRRAVASDLTSGNSVLDLPRDTVLRDAKGAAVPSRILAGDLQINGPGYLQVLAGGNIDLGTGANFADGTGVGLTSIGNFRNPFLPFDGSAIIAMAGVAGADNPAAFGLQGSKLDFSGLVPTGSTSELAYIRGLQRFFDQLRQAGEESSQTGSYASGYAAIEKLFRASVAPAEILTRARDIRTSAGGGITLAAPTGGLTMASEIFGNPTAPPGIVTEYGGPVSIFTHGNVDIGRTRIFTLRGGDMVIWSSTGDIAAGTSPKTVVTAPPTRVVIDTSSADVATDLGGLATGGGIGVLASVKGVAPGSVFLIAPQGTVDAGDAGIKATGDIKIAAAAVLNADNVSAGGVTVGAATGTTVASPNIGSLSAGSTTTAAASSAAQDLARQSEPQQSGADQAASNISVEVLGYGGGEAGDEEEVGA